MFLSNYIFKKPSHHIDFSNIYYYIHPKIESQV